MGCLSPNPHDPHCFLVWSTPVTRSSDGQSYIISWTGEGATNVTYRVSVNGGAEVTGESVVYHGAGISVDYTYCFTSLCSHLSLHNSCGGLPSLCRDCLW